MVGFESRRRATAGYYPLLSSKGCSEGCSRTCCIVCGFAFAPVKMTQCKTVFECRVLRVQPQYKYTKDTGSLGGPRLAE